MMALISQGSAKCWKEVIASREKAKIHTTTAAVVRIIDLRSRPLAEAGEVLEMEKCGHRTPSVATVVCRTLPTSHPHPQDLCLSIPQTPWLSLPWQQLLARTCQACLSSLCPTGKMVARTKYGQRQSVLITSKGASVRWAAFVHMSIVTPQ